MHRFIVPVSVLAAAGAVALAVAASGGAQAPSETVLTYQLRDVGGTFVDSRPKGDSRGDFVSFEAVLLQGGRAVGRERGLCVVANARTHVPVCTMGWALPGGSLTTSGASAAEPPFTMPVVGGTGRYAGARGIAETAAAGKSITFRLLP